MIFTFFDVSIKKITLIFFQRFVWPAHFFPTRQPLLFFPGQLVSPISFVISQPYQWLSKEDGPWKIDHFDGILSRRKKHGNFPCLMLVYRRFKWKVRRIPYWKITFWILRIYNNIPHEFTRWWQLKHFFIFILNLGVLHDPDLTCTHIFPDGLVKPYGSKYLLRRYFSPQIVP